jgi:hypothetical protein
MRRNKLPFYENFLQSVWREFWNKNRPVNSTAHFHRVIVLIYSNLTIVILDWT